jgi:dCMP deaminase
MDKEGVTIGIEGMAKISQQILQSIAPDATIKIIPPEAKRPSKHEYYLGIAEAVSKRSTCLRRHYGAVIVHRDEIIATGYNGSPRSARNCCDVGQCWREANGIPHGQQYEKCVGVHAEMNALLAAKRSDVIGATLYLYCFDLSTNEELMNPQPCAICDKLLRNSQVSYLITRELLLRDPNL